MTGWLEDKMSVRERIWRAIEESGVGLPPGAWGRIPNFRGAREAARTLFQLDAWRRADTVKVNPDSPQRWVRLRALEEGKTLVMPTPRLRSGFLLLDPGSIPRGSLGRASTIRGAFSYGRPLPRVDDLLRSIKRIDLIVEGSVAVNRWGERLGKGEGYGDLEFGILVELGIADREVPIATTVHDIQVVSHRLPQDPHDVPLDYIATPTKVIRVLERPARPSGIIREALTPEKVREIPILSELLSRGSA